MPQLRLNTTKDKISKLKKKKKIKVTKGKERLQNCQQPEKEA